MLIKGQIPWPTCSWNRICPIIAQIHTPGSRTGNQNKIKFKKNPQTLSSPFSMPLSESKSLWVSPPSSSQSWKCCSAWSSNDNYNHTNCIFYPAWWHAENWWPCAWQSCNKAAGPVQTSASARALLQFLFPLPLRSLSVSVPENR